MIAGGETQYRHSYGVFSPSSYPQQLTTPRSSGLQFRLRIIRHRLRGLVVRTVRGLRLVPIIDAIRAGTR